jgi:hypothetical protein
MTDSDIPQPSMAIVNISGLDVQQSLDYIHTLRIALIRPGTDFPPEDDEQAILYVNQIEAIKKHLADDLGYTG